MGYQEVRRDEVGGLSIPVLADESGRVVADDIIRWGDTALVADIEAMSRGTHYDYRAQRWIDGHDHAHCLMSNETSALIFCGADMATCVGSLSDGR